MAWPRWSLGVGGSLRTWDKVLEAQRGPEPPGFRALQPKV